MKKDSILLIIAVHCVEHLEYCQAYVYSRNYITRSPFITGVDQALYVAVENCLENVADKLKEVLAKNSSLPRRESRNPLEDLSNDNSKAVLLLYGVSGSGRCWGAW